MSFRKIAERHIEELENPAPLPTLRDILNTLKRYIPAMVFGTLSVGLYGMLYLFNTDLTEIAQTTHAGKKSMFFVPIVIALVFSFIHGTFTSHFWEILGIKAKKQH